MEDEHPEEDEEFVRLREERQREVDRLSLELLSNSKQYKKYIAKNHPEERLKRAEENLRFHKYKSRVGVLFMELLNEYDELGSTSLLVGTELQTMFKECVQKTIQHLEWTDYQNAASHEYDGSESTEDMLFGGHTSSASSSSSSRGKKKTHHSYSQHSLAPSSAADPFSFWGATIRKSQRSSESDEEP